MLVAKIIRPSKEYVHLGNKLVGQIATSGAGASSPVTGCGFNVEGVGLTTGDFTSTGLILGRYARGLTGTALITSTRADQNPANLTTVINAINAHMSAYSGAHDIDASGGAISVNDAIIIHRYLAGFRGASLTQGLALTGTRTSFSDIQTYIASGCPSSGSPTTTTTFIHPNVTGSPIMATNASGDPAWFENYSAFGERIKNEPSANIGSNNNQNWFIGKPVDSATGLVYFAARWYDPEVARFLSFDPAPVNPYSPHSFNRYAYGNNNPYKYLDPDGRQSVLANAVRAAGPVLGMTDSVRAGNGAPTLDPATGVMSNPVQGPSLPNIGGFLAAANTVAAMFTPIAMADRLAGIITSMSGNNIENQTRGQLIDSKSSYEALISAHRHKVADYKADPLAHDNTGRLANARPEHRQSIIDGRIGKLENDIKKQEGELKKINDQLEKASD